MILWLTETGFDTTLRLHSARRFGVERLPLQEQAPVVVEAAAASPVAEPAVFIVSTNDNHANIPAPASVLSKPLVSQQSKPLGTAHAGSRMSQQRVTKRTEPLPVDHARRAMIR